MNSASPFPASSATVPGIGSLGRLERELRQVCVHATQPEEIAAALEAHGLNDELARQKYGLPNVFACAEALYAHLPYREPPPVHRPEARPLWELAPRGLLYALPGAALAVASPLLAGYPGAQSALFVSVVFGWGWGQGLATIGYRKTGAPLRSFLRRSTLVTSPVAALVCAAVALLLHQPLLTAAAVGALAGASFAAFASLLIMGRPHLVALAYLPSLAALGAGSHLLGPGVLPLAHDLTGQWVAVWCAVLLPVLSLCDRAPLKEGLQLPVPAWHVTFAHALTGWTCALFVTLAFGAPLWERLGGGAILPVIVSVGAMEVLSVQFHGRLHPLARRYGNVPRLALKATGLLLGSMTIYLVVLSALLAVYLLITRPDIGLHFQAGLPMMLALLCYGGALLLGTVVSNVGQPWITSGAWLLGSLVFLLGPFTLLPSAPLLSSLVVLMVLAAGVLHELLIPATYR